MNSRIYTLPVALLILCFPSVLLAADLPEQPIAKKGSLIFCDDFERAELGRQWKVTTPTYVIADGLLRCSQTNPKHMEIVGDEMRASLDGKAVGYLKSSGIAHPIKSDFHFTVSGNATQAALFDDVRVWAAGPAK